MTSRRETAGQSSPDVPQACRGWPRGHAAVRVAKLASLSFKPYFGEVSQMNAAHLFDHGHASLLTPDPPARATVAAHASELVVLRFRLSVFRFFWPCQ